MSDLDDLARLLKPNKKRRRQTERRPPSQQIAEGSYTIDASGVIVLTSYAPTQIILIATFGGAASDDLATITNTVGCKTLYCFAADTANTVVYKDGTDNLRLAGDFSADSSQDMLVLVWKSSTSLWYEASRSDNST